MGHAGGPAQVGGAGPAGEPLPAVERLAVAGTDEHRDLRHRSSSHVSHASVFRHRDRTRARGGPAHWREPDSITHQKVISTAINFHPFDPNVLTEKEFVRLGLSAFISRRLVHFREKGGVFYKKEDLLKIYGIDSSWYARAKPWIAIASKVPEPKETFVVKKKVAEEFVDINTADSLQLIKVFGIGPSLSKRIRTFRARLGGFVSLEQLREVYGLDSSVVKEMKKKFFIANNYQPNKINLNTSDLKDLLKHPYIRWNEGQAILTYRLQHGNYASISDLHGIQLLTPAWIEKITPYLTLE